MYKCTSSLINNETYSSSELCIELLYQLDSFEKTHTRHYNTVNLINSNTFSMFTNINLLGPLVILLHHEDQGFDCAVHAYKQIRFTILCNCDIWF